MTARSALALALALALPAVSVLYAAGTAGGEPAGRPPRRAPAKAAALDAYQSGIAPLVKKYCGSCHGISNGSAGISLLAYKSRAAVLKGKAVWEKVSRNLGGGNMPPAGAPKPTAAERDRMVAWIDTTLSTAECVIKDPGHVTLRRLNRDEYNNTIRDLIGLDIRPADSFPSDDVGYGFDNIGDVLSISPLLMEKYLAAAEKVSQAAVPLPGQQAPVTRFQPERMSDFAGKSLASSSSRILMSNGETGVDFVFPRSGEYLIRVRAFQHQAGPEAAHMPVRIDGKEAGAFDVRGVQDAPKDYEIKTRVEAGRRRVTAAFTNEFAITMPNGQKGRRRYLGIAEIEIQGPLDDHAPLPDSLRRIVIATPAANTPGARLAAARTVMAVFAKRAWRRPATNAEIERLSKYVELAAAHGEGFEKGIQLGIQACLVSPNFLFRPEPDAGPTAGKSAAPLGDFELASRLSYFLWSSMPDDELFALAEKKRLQDPKTLAHQVARMLKDPKAKALADNFAAQWLTLRNLANVNPDPARFPEFNESLRSAMRTETEMFFQTVVHEDRSVLDFLDGRFTFVNEPLAKLYGLPTVTGDKFQRVSLAGTQRAGLLTQASVLTVTSNPTRTSPVKRGKWVLENILGTPPPPPLPNVPELKDRGELTGTLRQQMEQHRKDPNCATCHARMDPLGFGLENFNAVGAWRTTDGKFPIDSSGVLPDGKKFKGPLELLGILKAKKMQFVRCLAEKTLTYALGRGLESYDKCALDDIIKATANREFRYSAMVTAVVQSDPFRKRRGDTAIKQAQR